MRIERTAQGKLDEAEPLMKESLAIDKKAFGDGHRIVVNSSGNLGMILMDRGACSGDGVNVADEGRAMVQAALDGLVAPPYSLSVEHPWVEKFTSALLR